ncbi:MAG: UvrB/UvrC motif-containing protein [Minisyncoccota bacterium]
MDRAYLKKLKLPKTPGVYQFIGTGGRILYVGKATSLRDRVRSYFDDAVVMTRGAHIKNMVSRAKRIKVFATDSVLEALLLEAELIKAHHPPSNTKEKDDKSWNYLVITDENFPRVLIVRGKELRDGTYKKVFKIKRAFGPFPHGGTLREALRIIRKIFPFRDRCVPGVGRPCFNAQIGLCPGVCTGTITKAEYAKTIRSTILFCGGKKKQLINTLRREMGAASKKLEFEKAGRIKHTIFSLEHIHDVALLKRDTSLSTIRIEAYDIAHMSGKAMSGAMAVIVNGEPDHAEYRKFTIKSVKGSNDTAALKEMLARRFAHPEWPYPRLIVIDGGVAQKNAARSVLKELGISIPVVSVVKDEHHRARAILGEKHYATQFEKEIILANAESHRFALKHHTKLRNII